jgi:hypothetical protein
MKNPFARKKMRNLRQRRSAKSAGDENLPAGFALKGKNKQNAEENNFETAPGDSRLRKGREGKPAHGAVIAVAAGM